jgi:hypothetical protein
MGQKSGFQVFYWTTLFDFHIIISSVAEPKPICFGSGPDFQEDLAQAPAQGKIEAAMVK